MSQGDLFEWADKNPQRKKKEIPQWVADFEAAGVLDLCPYLIVRAATGILRYGEFRPIPAQVIDFQERRAS